jgi:hypothetical protein
MVIILSPSLRRKIAHKRFLASRSTCLATNRMQGRGELCRTIRAKLRGTSSREGVQYRCAYRSVYHILAGSGGHEAWTSTIDDRHGK